MFEVVEKLPADPILGLTEAYKSDPNPDKVNLGVGIYKDEKGQTPILNCVREAEKRLLDQQSTKSYLPMGGLADLAPQVQELQFGRNHEIIQSNRAVTVQTPGGTGGLRVAGDFIHKQFPNAKIWLSDPTWPNHPKVFAAAGMETRNYPYYDPENKCLAFDQMLQALKQVPEGDVVVFHACCHNPTGMDPSPEQWQQLAQVAQQQKFLPLFDFAYQGFGDGLDEDAVGVRTFAQTIGEMIIVSSFSKNFGLYNERVGGLTIVGTNAEAAQNVLSHLKMAIRTNYSNPPAHGAGIVANILGDPQLRNQWIEEVAAMRNRINGMRKLFTDTMQQKGVQRDFSFITSQRGMFSFSGLNREQVDALREKYSIYIVGSGRINVAGMSEQNMDRLCTAIKDVLGE